MKRSYIKSEEQVYSNVIDPWCNKPSVSNTKPRFKLYQQYHKLLLSLLPDDNKSIVDIGCGVGGLVSLINTTTTNHAVGVDTSSSALKQAREFYPACHYELGDIRTWRPKKHVDIVLSTGSYYHFSAPHRINILKHVKSYLVNNGMIVIVYGNDNLLSHNQNKYPDLSEEIFSIFTPYQRIYWTMLDNNTSEEIGFTFYLGVNIG